MFSLLQTLLPLFHGILGERRLQSTNFLRIVSLFVLSDFLLTCVVLVYSILFD